MRIGHSNWVLADVRVWALCVSPYGEPRGRGQLVEAGHFPGAVELQSWGNRDFRVRDLDGHYIRISKGIAVPYEN